MADDPAGDPPAETPDAPPDPETEPDPPKDDKLPPEIQEILNKERKAARDAAREAKTAKSALANATSELERFREAQLTEQEKAIKTARDEALAEGLKVGNERLIRAEVIAASAGKVADPSDAYAILTANKTLAGLEVDAEGNVDTAAITAAIDDLVKTKPHLAAVRSPSFGSRAPAQAPSSDVDMDAIIRGARG